MKRLLVFNKGILCAALSLTAQNLVSSPVLAQSGGPAGEVSGQYSQPFSRSITVSGTSKEQFAPDQAVLSMSLVSNDADLTKAKSANDAMVEKLVKITTEYKIPRQNVANSNIYIAPQYTYPQNSKPKLSGYQVSRQIRITMDSLNIHEKLLSAIVDAKIDQVNGMEFRLADPEAHAMGLRVKAFENAKAKAAALAGAAGAKLGKAITISTVSNSMTMPTPARPMMAKAMMADASEMSIAPSLPGMVELEESVTVSFSLE